MSFATGRTQGIRAGLREGSIMNIVNLNDQHPTYFNPIEFFKEPMTANEKPMEYLISLIGMQTEEMLSGLDKSLFTENYLSYVITKYLSKQSEYPAFLHLDTQIFQSRAPKKSVETEMIESVKAGAKLASAKAYKDKPPLSNGLMPEDIEFDYIIKQGHIRGIIVI